MWHISSNCIDKIIEETGTDQATTEQSTAPTTATVSRIKNKTDVVTGEQYAHICGCQYSQQEKKEGMKSWILLDSDSTRDILG